MGRGFPEADSGMLLSATVGGRSCTNPSVLNSTIVVCTTADGTSEGYGDVTVRVQGVPSVCVAPALYETRDYEWPTSPNGGGEGATDFNCTEVMSNFDDRGCPHAHPMTPTTHHPPPAKHRSPSPLPYRW